jgi:hypothetical protein
MPQPLLADSLSGLPGIAHGFFTRRGGVSSGIYASLNCGLGSQDDAEAVRENRSRVASHLGAQDLITAYQFHGTTAFVVTEAPGPAAGRPRADAVVTAIPGIAVGVLTADCAPVLLAEPQAKVVAAVHAGWRGALAGVVEAAIEAMQNLGANRNRISAAVGPCIGQAAYEVGPEFEAEFLAQEGGNARFFKRQSPQSRPRFALAPYVAHRLEAAGVYAFSALDSCTSARAEDFFSYRRSQAAREPDYGRQISAIVLT